MRKTLFLVAVLQAASLLVPSAGNPAMAQPRPAEEDLHARQQRYNQAIMALQQQHNQQVAGVEQAYNAHRINRAQLSGDIANLQKQYDEGVAEQRRILER